MIKNTDFEFENKIIPSAILKEANIALSHYPELRSTPIEFKFKRDIKKSFMQAQPAFKDLLKDKKHRSYFIMISESIHIEDQEFNMAEIPSEVLIGWLGHELGHVMDYRERSGWDLINFGIRYVLSSSHIKEAERAADTYAVNHGMGDYILATKDFILSHAHLSTAYKERIKRLYLSPAEILELVDDLNTK